MQLKYLSYNDVKSLAIPMERIINVVEDVFVEKGNGRVEMPPKPGIHPLPDAFIHAMPAYIPKNAAAGMKWVSGFPQNMAKGLPYIGGLIIVNDPLTGFPLCVMDCAWITAKRTGAATAVAAKYLARKDSKTVAIMGCGVQGRSNLEALKVVLPGLTTVKVYDINQTIAEGFRQETEKTYPCEVVVCSKPKDACDEADVIVTAGPILKEPTPSIERSWIKEGAFISPVDFDSYIGPDVFSSAAGLLTDDMAQQKYYKSIGYFQKVREPDGDLGDLLCRRMPGRVSEDEMFVSLNLGIALEDIVTARLVYDEAQAQNVGVTLPL